MKKTTFGFCIAVLLAAGCNNGTNTTNKTGNLADTTTASPSSPTTKKAWVAVDSATEMKAWMEYATPGTAHKVLAGSDGSWTGQTTMWMGIGAPPVQSVTTIVNKMIFNGRYQVSNLSGQFMGMKFEGMAITGYDNYEKKFVSTWIDNMGTGIMKMEGSWDSVKHVITYTGKMTNPANGMECEMKEIYTLVDANNEFMEMYGTDPKTGEMYKNMEVKLTRNK